MLAERLVFLAGCSMLLVLVEASGDCAVGRDARREDLRGSSGESVVSTALALPLDDELAEAD